MGRRWRSAECVAVEVGQKRKTMKVSRMYDGVEIASTSAGSWKATSRKQRGSKIETLWCSKGKQPPSPAPETS